ncbi:MAG: dienelactone hydrolase family protein [Nitrospinota bacterium]|nr:dienelactone hydrolase family protein [Nitrospinota bacterium]
MTKSTTKIPTQKKRPFFITFKTYFKFFIFFILILLARCITIAYSSQNFVIYSKKNSPLQGYLCKPNGKGPFPAVIYNHGGLGNIVGGAPKETCTALAKENFVGFSPIRRKTRQLKGHLVDVIDAIQFTKKLPYVDRDRMAMMGFSRGGLLTYQIAASTNKLKAFILMAPAIGKRRYRLRLEDANKIDSPVLLLISKNDTGSFRTHGTNLLEEIKKITIALQRNKRAVKLIIYPPYESDGHTMFFRIGNYWKDIVLFLRKNLKRRKL